jgi:APA family basic amino acid/polyamine antiporter
MVVTQVVGVGIFLTPATMMRTLGSTGAALGIWALMGALSIAGALCYAELTTRFPRAGGGYVFLREAFGPRAAFVSGWISLLVTDPGITAALAIGLAQYLLTVLGGSSASIPAAAIAAVIAFGSLTLLGRGASAKVLRWTAAAKLAAVAVLLLAAALRGGGASPAGGDVADAGTGLLSMDALAASVIAAFFAFGGWWELGRLSEEVEAPRRSMPIALVGGLILVTIIYASTSLAYQLAPPAAADGTDEAFVAAVGAALFGDTAARLLAGVVVLAVSGSLAATLLAAPRVYVAMARDHVFPARLARFDEQRGVSVGSTLIQMTLASVLIVLGTFDQILGYFVPVTIFFLGLSAAAILKLPRPSTDPSVFRAPWHPLPIVCFLVLIVGVLVLFAAGQPVQTMLGALVALLGFLASYVVSGFSRTNST